MSDERADHNGRGIGITGGGGHLGGALALGLAEAGAQVLVCGRHPESLDAVVAEARERKLAGSVIAQKADVGREDELEAALDRLEREAGGVHGWINNACSTQAERMFEMTREATDSNLSRGLGDLMIATQAVAARMRKRRDGAIVNVASMYAMQSPQPELYRDHPQFHNPPAYGAAKAGVIQFTRYAACHLAPDGIRVNCLSPGPFPRDEVRRDVDFEARLRERVPLGRVGEASEIVGPALFLLSAASSFVTGHNLVVDGGWSAW